MSNILDELLGELVELESAGHAVRFAQGDRIVEWVGTHKPERGEGRAFWGAVASSIGHSAAYVRDLYRVSKTFSSEHRDPEHDWSWFRECAREVDPIQAMERFDEMSVREIRESRNGNHATKETCPTCGRVMPS